MCACVYMRARVFISVCAYMCVSVYNVNTYLVKRNNYPVKETIDTTTYSMNYSAIFFYY